MVNEGKNAVSPEVEEEKGALSMDWMRRLVREDGQQENVPRVYGARIS